MDIFFLGEVLNLKISPKKNYVPSQQGGAPIRYGAPVHGLANG